MPTSPEPGTSAPGAAATSGPTGAATPVAQRLREAILNGVAPPGNKLRLDDLRAEFGVSLSPLREALSRLSAEGLVVGQENRGFSVAEVSRENLVEVTLLRAELEGIAVHAAVERGDDDWEERLVAVFHRLTKAEQRLHEGRSVSDWEVAHRDFHITLLAACDMPLLLHFCGILHDHNDRYRRLFLRQNPPQRNAASEHKDILDAVLRRDAGRAQTLLRRHIETTGALVQAAMPSRLGSTPARG